MGHGHLPIAIIVTSFEDIAVVIRYRQLGGRVLVAVDAFHCHLHVG